MSKREGIYFKNIVFPGTMASVVSFTGLVAKNVSYPISPLSMLSCLFYQMELVPARVFGPEVTELFLRPCERWLRLIRTLVIEISSLCRPSPGRVRPR